MRVRRNSYTSSSAVHHLSPGFTHNGYHRAVVKFDTTQAMPDGFDVLLAKSQVMWWGILLIVPLRKAWRFRYVIWGAKVMLQYPRLTTACYLLGEHLASSPPVWTSWRAGDLHSCINQGQQNFRRPFVQIQSSRVDTSLAPHCAIRDSKEGQLIGQCSLVLRQLVGDPI